MSSFICSPKHFNSLEVSMTKFFTSKDRFYCYALKEKFPILYEARRESPEKVAREIVSIVNSLRELNIVCVTLQYASHYENIDKEMNEQREYMISDKSYQVLNTVEIYKVLQCTRYQIETDHLDDFGGLNKHQQRAWDFLEIFIPALAEYIVDNTTVYDKAPWGL